MSAAQNMNEEELLCQADGMLSKISELVGLTVPALEAGDLAELKTLANKIALAAETLERAL